MGYLRNFAILLLSVILELGPIYISMYLYFQQEETHQNVNLLLFLSYSIVQVLRLIVNICNRLLIGWEGICHKTQIIGYQIMLIISIILFSEQILLIIDNQNLQAITWINFIQSFFFIVYFNIQIYQILGISKRNFNIINITILILIIHEIIAAIIIQIFIYNYQSSHQHYQNLLIYIFTLLLCYYSIIQKNHQRNRINQIMFLQFASVIYEIIQLLNQNSVVQKIHTSSALFNLYNLYFLYNQSNCQTKVSIIPKEDDKQFENQQSKCHFCDKKLISFDSIQIYSLEPYYSFDSIVYFSSCSHLFHNQCANYDYICRNKMCAKPYINMWLQKYHYKISLVINNENNNYMRKYQQQNKYLLLVIMSIIQIVHLIYLPFIHFLPDYLIYLMLPLYIIPNQITIFILIWLKKVFDIKYICLGLCSLRLINVSLIIKFTTMLNYLYSRFFYLIFLDFSNIILSSLIQTYLNKNLDNMSLFALLYNFSDKIILPINLLLSFNLILFILIKLEPQIILINIILLTIAVIVLHYINQFKQSNSNKQSLLQYILTYLINCCLVTFYIQIDQLQLMFQNNELFLIWFSIFIMIYNVKINLRSSEENDVLRFAQQSQIYDLEKVVYRGFQLKTSFLCQKCGGIQQQGQRFIFFVFCQHTFHEECLNPEHQDDETNQCTVCLRAKRFPNQNEQVFYLLLN